MSSYIIVNQFIKDQTKLEEYAKKSAPLLSLYDGEILFRGPVDQLAGNSKFDKAVILAFPNVDAAQNWYNSDEYQKLIPLRNEAMNCQFILGGAS